MKLFSVAFLSILCFVPIHLFGQKNYQAGYVVLNSGDTLTGEILDRDLDKQELFEKVKFKGDNSRSKKKFSPDQILAYGYGNHHFVSMNILRQSQGFRTIITRTTDQKDREFIKLIEEGRLSYYLFEFIDDDEYIENIGYFLKSDEDRFQRVEQGIFGLKKKQLSEYFNDCPELSQRLNNDEFSGALEILSFYNSECQAE